MEKIRAHKKDLPLEEGIDLGIKIARDVFERKAQGKSIAEIVEECELPEELVARILRWKQ